MNHPVKNTYELLGGPVSLNGVNGTGRAPLNPQARFRAAQNSRETSNLPSSGLTANWDVTAWDLRRLRSRCRYIAQNFPVAGGNIDFLTRRVIAGGLRIQAKLTAPGTDSTEAFRDENREIEKLLKRAWASGVLNDYGGFTTDGMSARASFRLGYRSFLLEGEVFFIRRTNRDPRRVISREWQMVESDQLADHVRGSEANGTNNIVQGVEFNKRGRPTAYHFFEGSAPRGCVGSLPSGKTKRIAAKNVIHFYRKLRCGQVRGIPILAGVILSHADVEEFLKAKITAEWVANSFAALAFSSDPENIGPQIDEDHQVRAGEDDVPIAPGMIHYVPDATDIRFADPNRPGGDTEGFVRTFRRDQAVQVGVSYEEYSGDYSKSNFASSRAAHQNTKMTFADLDAEVDELMIGPIYRDFIDQIIFVHRLITEPAAEDIYAHMVQHPKAGGVNPLPEIKADLAAIDGRISSRTIECAKRGHDFREVAEETVDEEAFINLLLKNKGLPIPGDDEEIEDTGGNGNA